MRNPKALAATDQAALFKTLLQDPEITAMTAISEILNELPDEAARMRVMRWSFGRFGDEFKRPLPDAVPASVPAAPLTLARPMEPAPPAPVVRQPAVPAAAEVAAQHGASDFATEISELKDLFQHPRQVVAGSFA